MFYFYKMQATGNDFIIINCLENNLTYSLNLFSKYLCNRHFGIGADGVLILEKSKIGADFKMRIYNQDGTEAEMCGNGIRCLAKYVYENGLIHKECFEIETLAGIKTIRLYVEGKKVTNIEVDIGEPIMEIDKIPVWGEKLINGKIFIQGLEIYPISIGNPHAVCFVEDLENIDIEKIGKIIENYKCFPYKTNVEFVQIIDQNNIKIKVWERGVGETLSCGSGACAAVVIANKYKSTESDVNVELEGGKLRIIYNNRIKLIGEAQNLYKGEMYIENSF